MNYQLPITNYELFQSNETKSIEYLKIEKCLGLMILGIFALSLAACNSKTGTLQSTTKNQRKIISKILNYNEHTLKEVDFENRRVVHYNVFDVTDEFSKDEKIDDVVKILGSEGFKEMSADELDEVARLKTNRNFFEGKIYSSTYYDGDLKDCKTQKVFVFVSLVSNENKTLKYAYGMSPFIFPNACSSAVR